MDYKKLGENIRKERLKQGLTIEDLAFKAGISPNYLGKIERAQTKLSLDTLIKISNALNLTADPLLKHEFDFFPNASAINLDKKLKSICSLNKDYAELLELILDYMSHNSKE